MKPSVIKPAAALSVGLLIILSLSAALLVLLVDAHQDTGAHAQDDADRLALMVEREISRNVDLIDLSIQGAADGVEQRSVMRLPIDLRNQTLFSRASAARYIRCVSVFDSSGGLIANSLDSGQKPDPLFRNLFSAARQDTAANQLLVGYPYLANDGITRLVTFSRVVRTTDGTFDGMVTATVDLSYFSEVLLDLHIGYRTVIQVSLRNGPELIRTLEPESRAPVRANFAQQLGEKFSNGLARLIDRNSTNDSITAQRVVPGTPMVVAVSLSTADIFADWTQRSTQIALLCIVVSLTFAALSVYLAHTLRMRARSEAAVDRLATTDALTELHNRRAFDRTYKHELEQTGTTGRAVSVLFVDIDNFKLYNDHYGHVAGDHALQAIAREIRNCAKRSSDFVCRYGGEEFVVVLPGDDGVAAMSLAEKIRHAIQQLAIPHAATDIGILTGSIGVASINGGGSPGGTSLLENADRALYAAKRAGRNRVCNWTTANTGSA